MKHVNTREKVDNVAYCIHKKDNNPVLSLTEKGISPWCPFFVSNFLKNSLRKIFTC